MEEQQTQHGGRALGEGLALAGAYLLLAKVGLLLAMPGTNATAVWAPAGLAFAAVLLRGPRIAWAVLLGATLANVWHLRDLGFAWLPAAATSLAVGLGNSVEALLGSHLVRRVTATRRPFERMKQTVSFVLLGALVGALPAAVTGVVTLALAQGSWHGAPRMWLTWWLGDAVGILVLAPVLLCHGLRERVTWGWRRVAEAAGLLAGLALVVGTVFPRHYPFQYFVVPLLIWAAFRFTLFETTVLSALVMLGAIASTALGAHAGSGAPLGDLLLYLQSYTAVISVTILLLAVVARERHAAVEELRAYGASLGQLVAERTADLEEANTLLGGEVEERRRTEQHLRQALVELALARDRAEAADRLKSAFLAAMSHELRTPLNSIIGFSGILRQGLAGPINDEQTRQLDMVCGSADHLLALINDVLDLSRIEAGQLQCTLAPFDLRASIQAVAASARPAAAKKGLGLDVEIADDVPGLTSDRRRVEQVLLNLIANGIKFTERGRVHVRASRLGDRVAIEVTDTGIGIREQDLDKLFKPFTQVDSGLARRHEGTGLGLSICKTLVELLGGTIRVRSEWGSGSTFGFEVPIEGPATGTSCGSTGRPATP